MCVCFGAAVFFFTKYIPRNILGFFLPWPWFGKQKKKRKEKKIGAAPPPSWRLWHLYRKWKDTRLGKGKTLIFCIFSSTDSPKFDDRLENRNITQTSRIFFSHNYLLSDTHLRVLCTLSRIKVFYIIYLVFREIKASSNEKLIFFLQVTRAYREITCKRTSSFCYAIFALARGGVFFPYFPPSFFDQIYDRFETHAGEGGSSDDPPSIFQIFCWAGHGQDWSTARSSCPDTWESFFCNVPFFRAK